MNAALFVLALVLMFRGGWLVERAITTRSRTDQILGWIMTALAVALVVSICFGVGS